MKPEEVITKYSLVGLEARAVRLMQLWSDTVSKMLPGHAKPSAPKGDPRRTHAFKVCYKMCRETEAFICESEHGLYVRAQIDILRSIKLKNGHANVDVVCLAGDRAWRRWKVWKKKYDSLVCMRTPKSDDHVPRAPMPKVAAALRKTREYLRKTGRLPMTAESMESMRSDGSLAVALNAGMVSPYYLVLSPSCTGLVASGVGLGFDVAVYSKSLDESAVKLFEEVFPDEPTRPSPETP